MTIRAVIFDRDNTLVYFDKSAIARLEEKIALIAPALDIDAVNETWQTWPGPWPLHSADEPWFWRTFWQTIATRHELSQETELALREIGAFYHTCFSAFPDAKECVE